MKTITKQVTVLMLLVSLILPFGGCCSKPATESPKKPKEKVEEVNPKSKEDERNPGDAPELKVARDEALKDVEDPDLILLCQEYDQALDDYFGAEWAYHQKVITFQECEDKLNAGVYTKLDDVGKRLSEYYVESVSGKLPEADSKLVQAETDYINKRYENYQKESEN